MVKIIIKKKQDGKLILMEHKQHSGKKHLGSSRPIEIHNNAGETVRVCFLTLVGGDKIVDYFIDPDHEFMVDPNNDTQGWFEVPASSPSQPYINFWAAKAWGPDSNTGPRGSSLLLGANPTGNPCDFSPGLDFKIFDHVADVVIDPGN